MLDAAASDNSANKKFLNSRLFLKFKITVAHFHFKNLILQWNRFWFSEYDPFALGVFRIGVGALYFLMLLALSPNWERNYALNGISSIDLYPAVQRGWSLFHWTENWFPVGFWLTVAFFATLSFIFGFFTRTSTLVLFLIEGSLVHRARMMTNGEDMVFRTCFFYSLFLPLGAELSLDRLLQRGRASLIKPLIWPNRLLQLNLMAVYAFSLPFKLTNDPTWLNGEMMYWVLINENWSRWPWPTLLYQGPWQGEWVRLISYSALLVEGLSPILIWFRKTRGTTVLTLMAFHTLIAILIKNVAFFSLSMVVAMICFLPGEDVRRYFLRITKFLGRSKQGILLKDN